MIAPAMVGAAKTTIALIAAEVAQEIGGLFGDYAGPTTFLGAMGFSARMLYKVHKDSIALSEATSARAAERADAAEARLEAEQARWDIRETTLLAEIERLRGIAYPPPPKDNT